MVQQTPAPGEIQRGLGYQAQPYATGAPLFHDNFSPYDYNYNFERRHRQNVWKEEQERQRQLQWEGLEQQKSSWAYAWKQRQGYLPNGAPQAASASPLGSPLGHADPADAIKVSYAAPLYYPEDYSKSGLHVDYPPPPQYAQTQYAEAGYADQYAPPVMPVQSVDLHSIPR